MLLFYVNYDIIFAITSCLSFHEKWRENMITIDGMELVGRAFKIPKEGITFKNLKGERFNIFPAETKGRIFNHSKNKDFYIFAAGFGTFIIPALFGLDALLKSFNFKRCLTISCR